MIEIKHTLIRASYLVSVFDIDQGQVVRIEIVVEGKVIFIEPIAKVGEPPVFTVEKLDNRSQASAHSTVYRLVESRKGDLIDAGGAQQQRLVCGISRHRSIRYGRGEKRLIKDIARLIVLISDDSETLERITS